MRFRDGRQDSNLHAFRHGPINQQPFFDPFFLLFISIPFDVISNITTALPWVLPGAVASELFDFH